MTQSSKTSSRTRLGLAGASLVLAGAATLPVAAQAADAAEPVRPATDVSAPEANAATEALDTTANQIVVRDAETGQLRAPTASEAKALQTLRPATAAAAARSAGGPARAQTLQRTHRSGAVGARLSDEFMTYSVAVRQPDGSLATQCFNSKSEADAAMKAAAASSTPTPNTPAE